MINHDTPPSSRLAPMLYHRLTDHCGPILFDRDATGELSLNLKVFHPVRAYHTCRTSSTGQSPFPRDCSACLLSMPNLTGLPTPIDNAQPPQDTTSSPTRVLGLGPPVIFECGIKFTLYCCERTRHNFTKWVAVRSSPNLTVTFNTRDNVNWVGFQHLVADKSNRQYNNIARLILDGTNRSPPTITWRAYVIKNREWTKSNLQPLSDQASFLRWIFAINESKQAKGGVILEMSNPQNQQTRARAEDLLAMTEHDSDGPEFSALDLRIEEIYAQHAVNTDYDRIHPVFLDPANHERYILLTSGNVQQWDRALCQRVPGNSNTFSEVSPPSSVAGDSHSHETTFGQYLEYIGIGPLKREEVLNVLLDNNIDNYRMFKSLTSDQLRDLGFSIGIITKLRSNVASYKAHLQGHHN
ncbi:hypothetical protein PGTUg99_027657 [Puccinia graminis f. sp. tritici]|uniref:SAM domain-containing protein n=1 Tax=Puccinia graminis f. sp. tritici TaxID=56615 RepID=A0A5B0P5B7_PUCGR|nr:hypothetical protein PGTUg99_027657 [Puccinia graminis f. sp. tritici]